MKLGKPWVYGGCIGSHGQTMTILPGETPCLRCVFEAAPAPGEAGTCETAGVLSPIVNIVASFQAAEAFKILTGRRDKINRELIYIDVWENIQRRIKIAPLLGKVDCPCCQRRRFEWLDGEQGSQTTSLCGRNAVQVAQRTASATELRGPGPAPGNAGRGELQPLPAQVRRGRLRVHGLPRRPGDHQGDERRGQGADVVREVHRALTDNLDPCPAS